MDSKRERVRIHSLKSRIHRTIIPKRTSVARRFSLCFIAALFLGLALAWLLARWWPAVALDRALLVALVLPLFHPLLMLWLWFSPHPSRRWLRIGSLGLVCALAIILSGRPDAAMEAASLEQSRLDRPATERVIRDTP